MNAVVVRAHGGLERLELEDRPSPGPAPGEVRVRVMAAGVNHLDLWVRRGVPGHRFPLPLVLGSDASGVVDEIGEGVRNVQIGQDVVVLPGVSCGVCRRCLSGEDFLCRHYAILGEARDGTCAEFVVVPAANVAAKPGNLSFAEAATIALVFQTAWSMLVRKARLGAGESILVQAGASGVGSAAIQIARLLGAAPILTTASSHEKRERALELGADHAIDYTTEDFVERVRDLTGGRGVDVVFEHVGKATFEGSVRSLARGGRLVTCGATTGSDVELSLRRLFFKNLQVLGSTMGSKADVMRILGLFEHGRFKTVLSRRLPLAEIREAHRLLEQREVFGKIVVEP